MPHSTAQKTLIVPITTNEQSGSTSPAGSTSPVGSTTTAVVSPVPEEFTTTGPFVDLWDLGRTNARYWWTVVPVTIRAAGKYQDAESPQDACAAGDVIRLTGPATADATLANVYTTLVGS